METKTKTLYIHMYEEQQCYGGAEEGGWWYDYGVPVGEELWQPLEVVLIQRIAADDTSWHWGDEWDEKAYALCRRFNEAEHKRRKTLSCKYTDTCSNREVWYTFDVSEEPQPRVYPLMRPHYE